MNFAWLAPYFAGSAIAAVSNSAVMGLIAAGHGVSLIGTGGPPWCDAPIQLFGLPPGTILAEEVLAPFDAIVYNVGNHPSSYPLYRQAMRTPGIVILHDRFYADGLSGYAATELGDEGIFIQFARRAYGDPGVRFAQRVLSQQRAANDDEAYPLWEPLVSVAQAVVVPSQAQAAAVSERWSGTVLVQAAPDGTPSSARAYADAIADCAAATARRRVVQGAKAMVRRAFGELGISDCGHLEDRLCGQGEELLADVTT